MRSLAIATLAIIASEATADTFCTQMEAMAQPGSEATLTLPTTLRPAECRVSQLLGRGQERNCHWAFPYRSTEARDAFADVLDAVTACLGPDIKVTTDQSVNHPDAYDLRLINHNGKQYAVSIKDKGALQQTLVFVRFPVEP
jgi:hypothetical protein